MIAKRRAHRRGWPRGLYEPRPGYFVFRSPDGKTYPIGRVPLAAARNEAIAANAHLEDLKPSLVEQMQGGLHTIADAIAKMDPAKTENTAKSLRSLDKQIVAHFGRTPIAQITVKDCADLLETVRLAGKDRTAQALRVRMVSLLARACELGWRDDNPASVTSTKKVSTKRERLTLDVFRAIYDAAPQVNEWLQRFLRLALVTAADRSSICGLRRERHRDGVLTIKRPKTGKLIAIPTHLTLDAMGWTLADILAERPLVVSPWVVCHVRPHGNAPAGSPIFADRASKAFMEARRLAGIPDVSADGKPAPTLHEVRSLAIRLYEAQGGVDTQALAGHSSADMTAVYADPRGVEAVMVKVHRR